MMHEASCRRDGLHRRSDAVSMSKKQPIVKNLNSIQNFGAIDILCTDKNGTLTQDKVVLVTSLKKAYVRHYGELL